VVLFAASCALFGTWFALSVVKQFRPIDPRAFWLENFTFVPRWWFFKYNFEEGEFRISVRPATPPDEAWTVVEVPRAPFWRQWIWNPEMRIEKELWDACTRLCNLPRWLRFSRSFNPSTVAYKALVAWVSGRPEVVDGPDGPIQLRVERAPLSPPGAEAVTWFVSRPFVAIGRGGSRPEVPIG